MKTREIARIGKRLLVAMLALCMTFMMVPAVAFADAAVTVENATNENIGDIATSDKDTGLEVIDNRSGNENYTEARAGNVTVTTENGKGVTVNVENGGDAIVSVGKVASDGDGVTVTADMDTGETVTASVSAKGVTSANGTGAVVESQGKGGQATFAVWDGDVTGKVAGLEIKAVTGVAYPADVLVNGTVEGKDGVVVDAATSVERIDLVVWKIEADGGDIVKKAGATTDSQLDKFAKAISYIARISDGTSSLPDLEDPYTELAGNLRATYADGKNLSRKNIYFRVAHEGERVYLAVDEGYRIVSASNAGVALVADADGRYSIVVPRGGGIDLKAVVEAIAALDGVVPMEGDAVEEAEGDGEPNAVAIAAGQRWPLLTYKGVEINEVKLEMDGQLPMLRTTLTNTNDSDVEFDCGKFKVVKVDDDEEIAFDTEAKQLKANEAGVKCEFKASANALNAGDMAYVFYAGQLLGTFTVA